MRRSSATLIVFPFLLSLTWKISLSLPAPHDYLVELKSNSLSLYQHTELISSDLNNTTSLNPLSVWPKLPWWTKLKDSDPEAFIEVYSLGSDPLESHTLQELVLLPLSLQIHRSIEPAATAQKISSRGINALFSPIGQDALSKELAAKAVAALAFFEGKFGGRPVEADLRLGTVKVASITVWLSGTSRGQA